MISSSFFSPKICSFIISDDGQTIKYNGYEDGIDNETWGESWVVSIDEKNSKSVYIPPGFAHGFQTLDKENYVIYSCTKYRNKNSEISINPLDRDLKIKWPNKIKIISDKDKFAPSYSSVLKIL